MACTDEVAWHVADEIGAALPRAESQWLFVKLGAGDTWSALVFGLSLAVRHRLWLSSDLCEELLFWLQLHTGNFEEPIVRQRVAVIVGWPHHRPSR